MNRLAVFFDRYIAQAIFGHYCMSTALLGLFESSSMLAYVRAGYGSLAIALIGVLLVAGALLQIDALVRIIPTGFFRSLSTSLVFGLFARYRHWLFIVGIFWTVVLIAVSGAQDQGGSVAFMYLHGGFAVYGAFLMVRDGCIDNFKAARKRGRDELV